jgi:hypothetical protein
MPDQWKIVPHACRQCFGRVLVRAAEHGQPIARCSDCGFTAAGDHLAICACGALPARTKVRLTCVRNERPTPEAPFEIVVVAPTASNTAGSVGGNLAAP